MDEQGGGRKSVAVRLGGQEYKIVSEADPSALQQLAGYVDDALENIRRRTGTVDSLEVALLTSLNMARELLASRARLADGPADVGDAELDASDAVRIERLIERIEAATHTDFEAVGEPMDASLERLEPISSSPAEAPAGGSSADP